ncbi:hypothetical protein K493DRAFT_303664 [Basidiobolus meristosporus CBS 931.73]|uniref:Uncharacterized protein n=1 Tax=Basidiobolus meristosporus CBS 931.73 TaxID=1314790 RepID=A0A1Y1Y1V2_9FUNG|nr:hypothetical protein K493DRAFT_303664 [Basidiobolus meristosporus CBS 931.73]|eukprot:ORX91990.1 hypothetical protein K493DRAFT_303664 [Basidiobolus meristosporus CBS 931.73]
MLVEKGHAIYVPVEYLVDRNETITCTSHYGVHKPIMVMHPLAMSLDKSLDKIPITNIISSPHFGNGNAHISVYSQNLMGRPLISPRPILLIAGTDADTKCKLSTKSSTSRSNNSSKSSSLRQQLARLEEGIKSMREPLRLDISMETDSK